MHRSCRDVLSIHALGCPNDCCINVSLSQFGGLLRKRNRFFRRLSDGAQQIPDSIIVVHHQYLRFGAAGKPVYGFQQYLFFYRFLQIVAGA